MVRALAGSDPTADDPPLDAPAVVSLCDAAAEDEVAVLDAILTTGVDQGWFLRPDPADLIVDPTVIDQIHDEAATRSPARPSKADPWATGGPPADPIPGDEPGWVVLTQRCDLVRAYAVEPLVELAPAFVITDANDARAARLNSSRFVAITDLDKSSCWAVDLRRRAWLPKDRLVTQSTLVQPLPSDRARKRFRLRLGQRYWRDPVPDDLVETLQRPLRDAFANSSERVARMANFIGLWGERVPPDKVLVVAVFADKMKRGDAEADWEEVVKILAKRKPEAAALLDEDSNAYHVDDLSLGQSLDMFKFDLDELTYGKKASTEQAEPAL